MNNDRLTGLFSYMDRLQALSDVGHTCTREITECIKAIREELALGNPITISVENVTIQSDEDIRKVAEQLSERIVREGGNLA